MNGILTASVGILLSGAFLITVLRPQRPELATVLSLATGAAVVLLVFRQITPLLAAARRMMTAGGFSSLQFSSVLKAAGICLVTQLTADTCRDAGETALAAKAELVGRVLLMVVAIPLYESMLTLVSSVISGQGLSG